MRSDKATLFYGDLSKVVISDGPSLPCSPEINDLAVSQTLGRTPEVLTRFSPVSALHPEGVEAPFHERRGGLHEDKGREGIGAAHAAPSS